MAIKSGLGKLELKSGYREYLSEAISSLGLRLLPILFDDCVSYESLFFPLQTHRDPYDPMIITHANRYGLSIVGKDTDFDAYGVTRLW